MGFLNAMLGQFWAIGQTGRTGRTSRTGQTGQTGRTGRTGQTCPTCPTKPQRAKGSPTEESGGGGGGRRTLLFKLYPHIAIAHSLEHFGELFLGGLLGCGDVLGRNAARHHLAISTIV